MSSLRKNFRRVAIGGAIGALISATLLSAPAFAANGVDCGNRTDLVKIWSHSVSGDKHNVTCFANAGWVGWGRWTDEVSTGNNRVSLHDGNGAVITLEKWTDYRRSSAMNLADFTIL